MIDIRLLKIYTEQNLFFIIGLNVDGLYRVSGNLAVIQKLRFAVNHGEFLYHM